MSDTTDIKADAGTAQATETPETTEAKVKEAKGKKGKNPETTEAKVTVKARRPIRTAPGKGLFTKGDLLTVTAEEAKALIASGAAEAV